MCIGCVNIQDRGLDPNLRDSDAIFVWDNATIMRQNIQNQINKNQFKGKLLDSQGTLKQYFDLIYEYRCETLIGEKVSKINLKTGESTIVDESQAVLERKVRDKLPTFELSEGSFCYYDGDEDYSEATMLLATDLFKADFPTALQDDDPASRYYKYHRFTPQEKAITLIFKMTCVTSGEKASAEEHLLHTDGTVIKARKNKIAIEDLDFAGASFTVSDIRDKTKVIDTFDREPFEMINILTEK